MLIYILPIRDGKMQSWRFFQRIGSIFDRNLFDNDPGSVAPIGVLETKTMQQWACLISHGTG